MSVKLDVLDYDTEFTYQGRTFKRGNTRGPNPRREDLDDLTQGVLCKPKMGGVFQSSPQLLVWIPTDAEVSVY